MGISIVIPVYNVERFVGECINSILEEKEKEIDIEIIVINDGSTDYSLSIVQSMAKKDKRIKIFDYQNEGLSAARNRGLKHSSKEYILFLDSDDKLDVKKLSSIYSMLKEYNLDCLFYGSSIFYDPNYVGNKFEGNYRRPNSLINKVMSGPEIFNAFIAENEFIVSACMYVFKSGLLKNHNFFEGIYHEDNLFTTKLCLLGEEKRFSCCDIELYQRRIRNNSIMTMPKTIAHVKGYFTVYKELSRDVKYQLNKGTKKSIYTFLIFQLKLASYSLSSNDVKYTRQSVYYRLMIIKESFSLISHGLRLKEFFILFSPKLSKFKKIPRFVK